MRGLGFTIASSNLEEATIGLKNENRGFEWKHRVETWKWNDEFRKFERGEGEMIESERGVRTNIH
jgi:hypothetical protein